MGIGVESKSWDQLREPDQRALVFTPWGLGPPMTPEANADYLQKVLATLDLAPEVAEGTRRSFDRLRCMVPYGILNYEVFTAVADLSLLSIEQALRDRFLAHHQGTVVFVDPRGDDQSFAVTCYDDVFNLAQKKGKANAKAVASARAAGAPAPALWELKVANSSMRFDGMLAALREWARRLGLLRGQRNRWAERGMTKQRNLVAHPGAYKLETPVETLSMLSDLAEMINQLWGKRRPGGRLYPAPIRREVTAFAWREGNFTSMRAEHIDEATDVDEGYLYAIALAVSYGRRLDPHLARFDSLYETTAFPVDVLWGPGTRREAAQSLSVNQPEPDEFDYLDRLLVVRAASGQLSMPMRPAIAVGLAPEERHGRWHLVRADYPNDAFTHARNLESGVRGCAIQGPCRNCHAETVQIGTFAETVLGLDFSPIIPPDVRGPFAGPRGMPIGPAG